MARIRHLSRPPIREALVDLRVARGPELLPDRLMQAHELVRTDYPVRREHLGRWFHLPHGKDTPSAGDAQLRGFWFSANDQSRTFQARVDGFTFNQVRHYESWEATRNEAHRLWQAYLTVAQPRAILRVGLRYINDLHFPEPQVDRFLTAPPPIPPGTTQDVSGFLSRLILQDRSTAATIIVTQIRKEAQENNTLTVTLDIDVFRDGLDLDPTAEDAWQLLDRLRSLKNEVFFSYLTEEAVELFA